MRDLREEGFKIYEGRLEFAFGFEPHKGEEVFFAVSLWIICHLQLYNICN